MFALSEGLPPGVSEDHGEAKCCGEAQIRMSMVCDWDHGADELDY